MTRQTTASKWRPRKRANETGARSAKLKLRTESGAQPVAEELSAPKMRVAIPTPMPKLRPAKAPRDQRVPLAELDDLHVKTIEVIGGSGIGRVEISRRGGPAVSTMSNWENHRVRRPALATVRAALKACGYSLAILDPDGQKI
jgi:hypothetical protein